MTKSIFSRASKFALDYLSGNTRRRRHLKARALYATTCGTSHRLIKARVAAGHPRPLA